MQVTCVEREGWECLEKLLTTLWVLAFVAYDEISLCERYAPMASAPSLTLPPIAPPLPNVARVLPRAALAELIVVRPLAREHGVCAAVEGNEREVRQVDVMDLIENLLPHALIQRCQFLLVEGIQFRIAVEVHVVSIRRHLVAREHGRIVGVIAKALRKLGDVISARHGDAFPPVKNGPRNVPNG